ncbi:hypothetical protein ACLB2K_038116 [Fragaria x ananassa]
MRWHQARHQGEERIDPYNLTHPTDEEAWKHFDRSFPEFAGDSRNVRLGFATDGFNPTGNMNLSYSIWPTTKKNSISHPKLPRLRFAVAIGPFFATALRRQSIRS